MKKRYAISAALLAGLLCFGCSSADDSAYSNAIQITLADQAITVNGEAITEDSTQAVYATSIVETHEDVAEAYKDTANTVICITEAGDYALSGSMENVQIRVSAPKQNVNLILDGVELINHTAPAIYIEDAADPQTVGEAGAVITLAEGSTNIVNGSHVAEYIDENGVEIDNDGAISSNVSLAIDGTGALQVRGDKEGIEGKLHLTINNGTIQIASSDDAINGNEDGVSAITINDGIVNCSIQNGEEGDGIDSNGYIYINGGFVVAQAHSSSEDSGLDADLGIIINGGTVCATGNMYEEISAESAQQHAQFYFAEKQQGGVPLVITDTEGNYVLAYTPINDYNILEFSSADLVDGNTYYLYSGGTLSGTVTNGVYTEVESYTDGIQLAHRGVMMGGGRPAMPDGELPEGMEPPADGEQPQRPEGNADGQPMGRPDGSQPDGDQQPPEKPADGEQPAERPEAVQRPDDAERGNRPGGNGQRPDGQMPEDFDPDNLPEGFDPSAMPQGGFQGGANFNQNAAQSIEFVVSADSRVYNGIAPYTGDTANPSDTTAE